MRTPLTVVERSRHPVSRRNYRVATAAIEDFLDLVERCIRVLIPGALIYARPRMGKTHAIEYIRLYLARERPDVLTLQLSCEHHRADYEGPFFSALLTTVGAAETVKGNISHKRRELRRCIVERLNKVGGHVVALFCDEAQRLSTNGYEWLRDVHDKLASDGVRLITFLVGQPQLLAKKAAFQISGDEQIVSRFMIEQMQFRGISDASEAATCLGGYDHTCYPENSGPTFTEFFLPKAYASELRLEGSAAFLWNAFVRSHAAAQLPGVPEIQMDYFTRAIESLLLEGVCFDRTGLTLGEAHWARAVEQSGYVAAQRSVIVQDA